jgi:hypothetical protein
MRGPKELDPNCKHLDSSDSLQWQSMVEKTLLITKDFVEINNNNQ